MREKVEYHGDVAPQYIPVLESRLRRGERASPLVFQGRDEIISHIKFRLQELMGIGLDDDKCFTEVIQGAPGAGKTALINELKQQLGETVAVVSLNGTDLSSPDRVVAGVLPQLKGSTMELTKGVPHKISASGGVPDVVSGTHIREIERNGLFESREIVTVWQMIEKGWNSKEKTIVLCLDEAQTTPAYLDAKVNQMVIDLHTTSTDNLNVLPVFTGLLDTRKTLGERGASRLSRKPFELGVLTKSEAKEVVIGVLNHESLGLSELFDHDDQEYIATSLMIASDQWPRHLHYYVQGVLQEVLNDQQSESPHHQIDLNRALDFGHETRIDYYEDRIASLDSRILVKALTELSNQHQIDVDLLIDQFQANQEVEGLGFDEVFRQAIHIGILTPIDYSSGREVTRMPIPSMQTYFQCQLNHQETLLRLRQVHTEQLHVELAPI